MNLRHTEYIVLFRPAHKSDWFLDTNLSITEVVLTLRVKFRNSQNLIGCLSSLQVIFFTKDVFIWGIGGQSNTKNYLFNCLLFNYFEHHWSKSDVDKSSIICLYSTLFVITLLLPNYKKLKSLNRVSVFSSVKIKTVYYHLDFVCIIIV